MSIATRPDLEVIEALDFEHAPECEHSEHPRGPRAGPAYVLARFTCPECPHSIALYLCRSWFEHATSPGAEIYCARCGTWGLGSELYTVLGWVGS